MNTRIFNCILNDSNKEVDWYQQKNSGDSIFREKTIWFHSCDIIKKDSITLNSLLETNKEIIENCQKTSVAKPFPRMLIKIDCQGAEISILKGATDIFNNVDFIILEIPLFGQYNENVPNFLEHIKFMDEIGFIPYEFLENHYYNGFNIQIDMLFINKNHDFNKLVQENIMGNFFS